MIRAFLHRLPQRILASYSGYRWLWHVLAALLTAALVLSGFDWWFFEHTRASWLEPVIFIAGIGGFFMPIAISVGLYVWSELSGRPHHLLAGVAVLQASAAALAITSFYKVFTGRIQPEFLTDSHIDISRAFHFGFLQNGVFWGWPSSHAAVAVACATALYLGWPNRAVRTAAVVWALIVCAGAAIGFHWVSDVVAGIVVGLVAGASVWKDQKLVK